MLLLEKIACVVRASYFDFFFSKGLCVLEISPFTLTQCLISYPDLFFLWLPAVMDAKGNERAYARNPQFIIDMLNNEFDRAAYLKYEQTESLLFFYVTYQIQSSFKFNYIACTKSSNQYTLTSSKHFFPFSKVLILIPTREFWKVFKDEIKMVNNLYKLYWNGKLLLQWLKTLQRMNCTHPSMCSW